MPDMNCLDALLTAKQRTVIEDVSSCADATFLIFVSLLELREICEDELAGMILKTVC